MEAPRSVPRALIAAVLWSIAPMASAQSVVAIHSSLKVRPTVTPQGSAQIYLHAFQNEFEPFQ